MPDQREKKQEKLKVSVVFPAYNEAASIRRTIETLQNQDFKGGYEIVVSNNNSTDETVEIAEEMGVRVVHEKRKGSRFAYDKGMREAKGELILVTNADVIVPENWISAIVKKYEDPEVVGVGTKVRYNNAPGYINFFLGVTEFFNFKRAMWGPSLSCRKWAFEKVGGFDHGVNTNEDGIFTLLIQKLGKVVYDDDVTVLMDGRRFNGGIISSLKEWARSYGLNSIYIQINYVFTGKIRTLVKDFGDVRSSVFGHGEGTAISVIIPTNNEQEYIPQVLSSLQKQNFEHRFKIYVLDNFSTDLSLDLAAVYPNVNVVSYPKIFSFSEKLAKLVSTIESPVIAVTCPKSILPTDWLSKIYLEFSKNRDQPLEVLSGPHQNMFSKTISSITNQPLDILSSKFEFRNFAIATSLMKELDLKKNNLEDTAEHISEELLERNSNIQFSTSFKSEYLDRNVFKGIATDTKESLKHTFKKLARR